MPVYTVFLLRSETLVWSGLRAALAEAADCHVVGEAATILAGIIGVRRTRPGLILAADHIGRESIADLLPQLRTVAPASRVAVIAERVEDLDLRRLAASDVSGCLLWHDLTPQSLSGFLATLAAGLLVSSPAVAQAFLTQQREAAVPGVIPRLTPRQREVLTLLADGATDQEIARQFHTSVSTVQSHVQNLLLKTRTQTRLQLGYQARALRLLSDRPP